MEDLNAYSNFANPDAFITISGDGLKATYTNFNQVTNTWLTDDKGLNFFDGDFSIDFEMQSNGFNPSGNKASVPHCTLTNIIDDAQSIIDVSGDELYLFPYSNGSSQLEFRIAENDGGTVYSDISVVLSFSTLYYNTFRRDESVGSFGAIFLDIYSDAARTIPVDTIQITLHTSKKDFQYFSALQSISDSGSAANLSSGFVQNIEIAGVGEAKARMLLMDIG